MPKARYSVRLNRSARFWEKQPCNSTTFTAVRPSSFPFYRIPKVLPTGPAVQPLSTDAKVLYGILLDRMSLSVKNHWLDEQSRVYIIFTTEEIMEGPELCSTRRPAAA